MAKKKTEEEDFVNPPEVRAEISERVNSLDEEGLLELRERQIARKSESASRSSERRSDAASDSRTAREKTARQVERKKTIGRLRRMVNEPVTGDSVTQRVASEVSGVVNTSDGVMPGAPSSAYVDDTTIKRSRKRPAVSRIKQTRLAVAGSAPLPRSADPSKRPEESGVPYIFEDLQKDPHVDNPDKPGDLAGAPREIYIGLTDNDRKAVVNQRQSWKNSEAYKYHTSKAVTRAREINIRERGEVEGRKLAEAAGMEGQELEDHVKEFGELQFDKYVKQAVARTYPFTGKVRIKSVGARTTPLRDEDGRAIRDSDGKIQQTTEDLIGPGFLEPGRNAVVNRAKTAPVTVSPEEVASTLASVVEQSYGLEKDMQEVMSPPSPTVKQVGTRSVPVGSADDQDGALALSDDATGEGRNLNASSNEVEIDGVKLTVGGGGATLDERTDEQKARRLVQNQTSAARGERRRASRDVIPGAAVADRTTRASYPRRGQSSQKGDRDPSPYELIQSFDLHGGRGESEIPDNEFKSLYQQAVALRDSGEGNKRPPAVDNTVPELDKTARQELDLRKAGERLRRQKIQSAKAVSQRKKDGKVSVPPSAPPPGPGEVVGRVSSEERASALEAAEMGSRSRRVAKARLDTINTFRSADPKQYSGYGQAAIMQGQGRIRALDQQKSDDAFISSGGYIEQPLPGMGGSVRRGRPANPAAVDFGTTRSQSKKEWEEAPRPQPGRGQASLGLFDTPPDFQVTDADRMRPPLLEPIRRRIDPAIQIRGEDKEPTGRQKFLYRDEVIDYRAGREPMMPRNVNTGVLLTGNESIEDPATVERGRAAAAAQLNTAEPQVESTRPPVQSSSASRRRTKSIPS